MELTVVINCFNEKNTILQAIQEAKELTIDKEIVVIDNCSTDGTRELLQGLEDDSLRIIIQPKNYGAGRSGKVGVEMARGKYLFAPGADLEYRMSDVYPMFKKLKEENLDAVFGSRLAAKKNMSKLAIIKERPYSLATIVVTYLTNLWYHRNLTDIIAPKLIKTDILKGLGMTADDQAYEFELASLLCKRGYKIGEIPVWYKPRSKQEGKTIRPLDLLPALTAMLKVKLFR
ncbi:MAG: glycosyltransferase family 2 protein [Candidatus Omnitrophica bacterium]|nr:glycosyltransferase family 2 protein [Candidatus Omnitrophota bacterium]MBU2044792.1 glycosyltransferase family 2 protein [Candidatus Omnitrophota bacterium]MBU2250645.1 glycosyltransferase family 2 protein [Candidatus Omnitrophota bacterium]MBU2265651.1 glycosyltransferase family 2 protein [Candidatus Omnitrophota bacterium]